MPYDSQSKKYTTYFQYIMLQKQIQHVLQVQKNILQRKNKSHEFWHNLWQGVL